MKKLFLIGVFIITSVSFATVADGIRAIDSGDYVEAVKQFEAAVEQRNTNVKALYLFAKSKVLLAGTLTGKEAEELLVEAVEIAKKAIALDETEPEAHFELARALGRLAQYRGVLQSLGLAGEMKKELEKTIELDPSHGSSYHALALWHDGVPWIAGGRAEQTIELFEKSIELEPNSIIHLADYAEILINKGEIEHAKALLEIAITLEANTYIRQQDKEFAQSLWDSIQ